MEYLLASMTVPVDASKNGEPSEEPAVPAVGSCDGGWAMEVVVVGRYVKSGRCKLWCNVGAVSCTAVMWFPKTYHGRRGSATLESRGRAAVSAHVRHGQGR